MDINLALATLGNSNAIYDAGTMAELAAEMQAEQDAYRFRATRLKFPSGGSVAGFISSNDEMIFVPTTGIILISQIMRAWWPRVDGDQSIGGRPLCSSQNGRFGVFRYDDEDNIQKALRLPRVHPALRQLEDLQTAPAQYNCATCPMNEFIRGKGRSCKEVRRTLVMLQDAQFPVILTIPASSVSVLDTYCSSQAERGRAYFSVWTRFELERAESKLSGAKYARLLLTHERTCTQDEVEAVITIRRAYGELVRGMSITSEDYGDETGVPF